MYEKFLHQASKSELLSFFRRYENSMNKRKKYMSPKEFYLQENKVKKEIEHDVDFEPLKGGEDKK